MTKTELTTLLQEEVKGLSSSLVDADYSNAIDQAERDTGWSMPQTAAFNLKWMIDRSKRHLFFYLMSAAAAKFRVEDVHLQHKFEHYSVLIDKMDENFEKAQNEYAFEFAGVSAYEQMGHKIDAGFAYQSQTGRDETFDDDNVVLIHPNENS